MKKILILTVASTVALSGCGEPTSSTQAESAVVDAGPPIATGGECAAAFADAAPGLVVVSQRVVEGGLAPSATQYTVKSSTAGRMTVERVRLTGPDRRANPAEMLTRLAAFVPISVGAPEPLRQSTYGPELTASAIKALRPGGVLSTSVVEKSNFAGAGGDAQGEAAGPFSVTFAGCSTLTVEGKDEPVKVFDVRSVARSFDNRAVGAARDQTLETNNRYWVSERLGWILRNDTSGGAVVAVEIREPA